MNIVTGAAGFIGSNLVDRLLSAKSAEDQPSNASKWIAFCLLADSDTFTLMSFDR